MSQRSVQEQKMEHNSFGKHIKSLIHPNKQIPSKDNSRRNVLCVHEKSIVIIS